jgi:hypothetical protein
MVHIKVLTHGGLTVKIVFYFSGFQFCGLPFLLVTWYYRRCGLKLDATGAMKYNQERTF